jgi:hypothetical protein
MRAGASSAQNSTIFELRDASPALSCKWLILRAALRKVEQKVSVEHCQERPKRLICIEMRYVAGRATQISRSMRVHVRAPARERVHARTRTRTHMHAHT